MGMILNLLRVSPSVMKEILGNSEILEDLVQRDELYGNDLIDLDKAWDGIYWLLTGSSYIETATRKPSFAVYGSEVIDEFQDMGYGPASYVSPTDVQLVSDSLNTLSKEELSSRFDSQKMTKAALYPQIWDEGEEALEYLLEYFEMLQDFYRESAKRGMAVIVWVS